MFEGQSEAEKASRKLLLSIDFGTAYSSVAIYVDTRSSSERIQGLALRDIPLSKIKALQLSETKQISTQMAWYEKEGMWVIAPEMDQLIQAEEIPESAPIKLCKLCLEQSADTVAIRERVKGQLDKLPLNARAQISPAPLQRPTTFTSDERWAEGLVSTYLKLLWTKVKARLQGNPEYFADEQVECWIGVPK